MTCFFILHNGTWVQIVKEYAALNWQIYKSAATGQEAQAENYWAPDVWQQCVESNQDTFKYH